jgi:hypothetical protein
VLRRHSGTPAHPAAFGAERKSPAPAKRRRRARPQCYGAPTGGLRDGVPIYAQGLNKEAVGGARFRRAPGTGVRHGQQATALSQSFVAAVWGRLCEVLHPFSPRSDG